MSKHDHHTDEVFMRRALELALMGQGNVSPNPMVGSVVVHDGRIIGEGWHNRYGEMHAEVNALNSVKEQDLLKESTVYVSLEPCSHTGKTPPCTDLLIRHGVKKVVVANLDSNPLVSGSGIKKLRASGIEVVTGILDQEGRELNKRFFTWMEKQRPYIVLKWAETSDGFIAKENHDSKWISNEYSRQLTHKWRAEEDSILVGAKTAVDNGYLAFKAGTETLHVINLETKLQVLGYDRQVNGISFTPDGVNFIIHGGQELLFYNTTTWAPPLNLLLPREDTPYTISPSGKLLAEALPTRMRIYTLDKLQIVREINVPPSNAQTRQWQIDFKDDQTLNGYAVRWDTFQTSATVETGQWEVETGKTLSFETVTSASPDALAWLWGAVLPLPTTKGELEAGAAGYQTFRFISDTMLLVNSPHAVCWLKLFTGETTCFKDPDHILFATDGNTYTEVVNEKSTLLQNRSGETVFEVGAYRFKVVNRTGEWAVIDLGQGTDLYAKGKKLPQESVSGSLQGFAENAKQIVLCTLEKENTFTLTIIDKETGNALSQKKDNFLYKPILMTTDGTIYYLQRDLDRNQTILNKIDPVTHQISEETRISLPAQPRVMLLSATGLWAIGQEDGSVLVMARDGSQSVTFQGATSAVEGLAFSPNGSFLAVASGEGVRVFAVLP